MLVFMIDGGRPEHRRRLRGPARPRLRRLLRPGAYTAGWFASAQFAGQKCPNPHFGPELPHLRRSQADLSSGHRHPRRHAASTSRLPRGPDRRRHHGLFGNVIGLPTLRLRGDYLAIVTLGFGEILPKVARNGDNLCGYNLTNGTNGFTPIDSPASATACRPHRPRLACQLPSPAARRLTFGDDHREGTTCLGPRSCCSALTVVCSLRLRDSRLGRAWM